MYKYLFTTTKTKKRTKKKRERKTIWLPHKIITACVKRKLNSNIYKLFCIKYSSYVDGFFYRSLFVAYKWGVLNRLRACMHDDDDDAFKLQISWSILFLFKSGW